MIKTLKYGMLNKLKIHSLHIILALLVSIFGGSVLIGLLVQNKIFLGIDGWLYKLITQHFHNKVLDILITPFNFNFLPPWAGPMPSYIYFMVLGGLIYLILRKRELSKYYVLTIIIGSLVALATVTLDYAVVFRDRPFETLPSIVSEQGRAAWQALSSYPSGHARETALYSAIIASYIPRIRWILIIFVAFIAYSRVYLGAHYPSDVLAGTLIGYLAAKVAILISREVQIMVGSKGGKHGQKPK